MSSPRGGGGGFAAGILNFGGDVTLEYSAVVKNSYTFSGAGPAVGGVSNEGGTVNVFASLVALNTPNNCVGFAAPGCV